MDGVLEAVSPNGAVVTTAAGRRTVEFSPALEVVRLSGARLGDGGPSGLRPGMNVGMVGLQLPEGGFRATRLWVYDEGESRAPAQEAQP